MNNKNQIFQATNSSDTSVVVTGILKNNYRYYQLVIEDIWGLQTNVFGTGSSYLRILFTREFGQHDGVFGEIMIMDYNGNSPTKLTNNNHHDGEAIFFPDGNKILFQKFGNSGMLNFFTMNLDGNNQVNISNNDRANSFPNFTSDGSKIVYQSKGISQSPRISVMDISGSNQEDILIYRDNRHPDLSPDDVKVVYATGEWGNREIGMIDIDGSNMTRITNTSEFEDYPKFSPDGNKILFLVSNKIYIMDLDGTITSALINRMNHAA